MHMGKGSTRVALFMGRGFQISKPLEVDGNCSIHDMGPVDKGCRE